MAETNKDVSKGMENLSIAESSSTTFKKKPVIIIVVGMAGRGFRVFGFLVKVVVCIFVFVC